MKIIKNYKNIETCYLFDTEIDGPTISIFSGVHGDEISGIKANKKLLENILNNNIGLIKGKLIILLEANQNAIKLGKRQEIFNLNRLFLDNIKYGKTYEEKRAQELKQILKETDFFLDLHSTSGPTSPYIFCDEKFIDFAKKLGAPYIVFGWNNLDISLNGIDGDTETYVINNGGMGFTFESGSHLSIAGEKNAYQISLNFLANLEIIKSTYYKIISDNSKVLKIKGVYVCKTGNFKFELENLDNFSFVQKGKIIGFDGDDKIIAEENMILIMPNLANPGIGVDVFFIGEIF